RWIGAAALVLLIGVAPVLGFVPFQFQASSTVADHYLYLAMLGASLALGWIVVRWPRSSVAAGCLLAALTARSALQTRYWHDSLRLFSHAAEIAPWSPIVHNNLASALHEQARLALKFGDEPTARRLVEQALFERQRAVALKNDYLLARTNLAISF